MPPTAAASAYDQVPGATCRCVWAALDTHARPPEVHTRGGATPAVCHVAFLQGNRAPLVSTAGTRVPPGTASHVPAPTLPSRKPASRGARTITDVLRSMGAHPTASRSDSRSGVSNAGWDISHGVHATVCASMTAGKLQLTTELPAARATLSVMDTSGPALPSSMPDTATWSPYASGAGGPTTAVKLANGGLVYRSVMECSVTTSCAVDQSHTEALQVATSSVPDVTVTPNSTPGGMVVTATLGRKPWPMIAKVPLLPAASGGVTGTTPVTFSGGVVGVAVYVGDAVPVRVTEALLVGVDDGVFVPVLVSVFDGVCVRDMVAVLVPVGVADSVRVEVGVSDGEGVTDGDGDGEGDGEGHITVGVSESSACKRRMTQLPVSATMISCASVTPIPPGEFQNAAVATPSLAASGTQHIPDSVDVLPPIVTLRSTCAPASATYIHLPPGAHASCAGATNDELVPTLSTHPVLVSEPATTLEVPDAIDTMVVMFVTYTVLGLVLVSTTMPAGCLTAGDAGKVLTLQPPEKSTCRTASLKVSATYNTPPNARPRGAQNVAPVQLPSPGGLPPAPPAIKPVPPPMSTLNTVESSAVA